jgi:ribosomal subunit interface protein
MQTPVQVTFRDIEATAALTEYVEKRAQKLDTFDPRLTSCRVVVEAPQHRHHGGKRFHVRIDLTVPGAELVVGKTPPSALAHEDLYACIDDAFDAAQRVLQDHARRRRGDIKAHDGPQHGRVVRIFAREGYGFLEGDPGYEVYFHRNSVHEAGFERLEVGHDVRFVEELGEKGPQASSVTPLTARAH